MGLVDEGQVADGKGADGQGVEWRGAEDRGDEGPRGRYIEDRVGPMGLAPRVKGQQASAMENG